MGRKPCCDKVGLKKGPWTTEEDKKLINFILTHGQCCWRAVPKLAGLLRCGKSCRLRWTNYLRPDLKRGLLSENEEKIVIDLHAQLGNRWSKIASQLPGRTDNEIKNHWNTHIKKKLKKMGVDPVTHKPLSSPDEEEEEQEDDKETDIEKHYSKLMMQSTITVGKENEEQKDKCKTASPIVDSLQLVNNGFSIDDVPLIDPCDILVPSSDNPIIISPPSSLSSSSSSSSTSFSNGLEDLDSLPTFGWQCDFFWDDYFMSNLSFLMEDDDFDMNVGVQFQPPSV